MVGAAVAEPPSGPRETHTRKHTVKNGLPRALAGIDSPDHGWSSKCEGTQHTIR